MKKVITYGTYDLLHYGHIRLLERAKALGDYLIVGVTAEDFDKVRGKINVEQSLVERMEAVRATGLADKIIVEEYEGQKIDDIRRYNIDIFTVGSDWVGKFDYLNEYCEVVYLDRTQGVSSAEIRSERATLKVGFVGDGPVVDKYLSESAYVNGMECAGKLSAGVHPDTLDRAYGDLLTRSDAVYLATHPSGHADQIKAAIAAGVHVLCESPIAKTAAEVEELQGLAREAGIVLMDAVKTAYATAYARMLLLAKSGRIGKVVSVDATCTSLRPFEPDNAASSNNWGAMETWGPTALLPIVQLLGPAWDAVSFSACHAADDPSRDTFARAVFTYPEAVASFTVGSAVKAEGDLVIAGTEGYLYVPAPWWKTDYFEIRRENAADNKRYFYQLDGEGIRYQLVAFARAIEKGTRLSGVSLDDSLAIARLFELFEGDGCANLGTAG